MKTISQVREEIMAKSLVDEGFRAQMLDDPVSALGEHLGVNLPDGFTLHVHEDNGVDAAHIVLPPGAPMSGEEMEQIAAGSQYWQGLCDGHRHYVFDC